ncbi:hypothetical protein ACVWYG_001426 [Pedobacter sp. UYEF25]
MLSNPELPQILIPIGKFYKGDVKQGESQSFDDSKWPDVNLPHDRSVEGAFGEKWAVQRLLTRRNRLV